MTKWQAEINEWSMNCKKYGTQNTIRIYQIMQILTMAKPCITSHLNINCEDIFVGVIIWAGGV